MSARSVSNSLSFDGRGSRVHDRSDDDECGHRHARRAALNDKFSLLWTCLKRQEYSGLSRTQGWRSAANQNTGTKPMHNPLAERFYPAYRVPLRAPVRLAVRARPQQP